MSDEQGTAAAPVAEPAAPAAPEVAEPQAQDTQPSQPEQKKPEPVRPTTRKEARQQAIEAGKERAAQAESKEAKQRAVAEAAKNKALSEKAKNQPRDENGQKFVKEEQDAGPQDGEEESPEGAAEAAPEATDAAGEVASEGDSEKTAEGEDAAEAASKPKTVDIPIPEGHPLRDQGQTVLKDVPADQERTYRTMLNAAARSREVEESERKAALLEARLKALSGEMPAPYQSDPKYQALLEQVENAEGFGPDMRATLEAAFQALQNQHVQSYETEAQAQVEQRTIARSFRAQVEAKAPELLSVWADSGELNQRLPQLMLDYGEALDQYNGQLRAGQKPVHPSPDHFFKWMGRVYTSDPRVKARIQRMQEAEKAKERERIRQEVLAEQERKQAEKQAEASTRHAQRPPIGSSASTSAPPSEVDQKEATREAVQKPNRRRLLREQARQVGDLYAPR